MSHIPAIAARNIARSPAAFLQRPVGRRWIDDLASAYPHEAFPRDYHAPLGDERCNAIASRLLAAKRGNIPLAEALAEEFEPNSPYYTWSDWLRPDLEAYIVSQGRSSADDWLEEVQSLWEDSAADRDDSSPLNLIASYDTCEILYALTPTASLEDCLIQSHKPWSEPSELAITPELQYALNQIGYTIGDFRANSGNRHEAFSRLTPGRRRRQPLVTYTDLASLIENSCSSMFNFFLFAIVPLDQLIPLDLSKPFTIDPCWLSTMNPMSGTFFDVPLAAPITLEPGDGFLLSGSDVAYSPDNICGLHRPHYASRIANTPESVKTCH